MKATLATVFVMAVAVLITSPAIEAAARLACCCTGCSGCAAGCC
jgi:hypothetical protein